MSFDGRHYALTKHTLYPTPVQRPRPPILIGGNGPRLLALAATEADIVALSALDEIADQLVAHRARWGISYWVVFESAVDAFAPVVARLAGI